MCKALEQRGWIFIRTSGSHQIDKHSASTETISVPVHANEDLRPGTQRKLMRQAGLSDAE